MTPVKKTTPRQSSGQAKKKAAAPVDGVLELPIFSVDGATVGKYTLPEELFAKPWRADLVHQVTTAMQANARQNRAHTKDRSEVSGGGKKPWKQKGTGQARHGSTRSPIWRHGGITFGPRNERDYSEKINKKMRMGALASVLTKKAKDGELILVDTLGFTEPKSAKAKLVLSKLAESANAATLSTKKKNAALFALASYDKNAIKSFANFGSISTEEVRNLNPLNVMTAKYLIVENPAESFAVLLKRSSK